MKKLLYLFGVLFLSIGLASCNESSKIIKVGASSTPHSLILEQAKPYVESKGYKLDITVFNDYVLPNYALENGELDANYFQHEPYLEEFNSSNGTNLVSVLKVHFEPMGIYQGRKNHLEDYKSGDTIIIPSDKSNHDRAIELINKANLVSPKLVEVEAQNIPLMLSDCDYALVNGNYALSSNILNKCLITEDKTSGIALKLANIIAVKKGNENNDKTRILIEALTQENISTYISSTFGSAVIPMGGN